MVGGEVDQNLAFQKKDSEQLLSDLTLLIQMRQPSSLKWEIGPGLISQAPFCLWRSRKEKEKGSVRMESFLPRLNMRIHPKQRYSECLNQISAIRRRPL